jgi:hypothetical protein
MNYHFFLSPYIIPVIVNLKKISCNQKKIKKKNIFILAYARAVRAAIIIMSFFMRYNYLYKLYKIVVKYYQNLS